MKFFIRVFAIFFAQIFFISNISAASLAILDVRGATLRNNPLHDPVARHVAVFVPENHEAFAPLPVIYYLPGWDGSCESFIKNPEKWLKLTDDLAAHSTPAIFVVVDARTRWGGSQYLNSTAQGNYADYICDEIVPLVESRFRVGKNSTNRIIAGHSSGGFGALRLGMMRRKLFGGVISLSPDSDFPVSHLPLVKIPAVAKFSPRDVDALFQPGATNPVDGDVLYAIGLSAAYAPIGRTKPGRFEWLYDARENFQTNVWQRWLDADPLTMVQKNRNAFRRAQKIYLDGAAQDQFKANIGAKAIYDVLRKRKSACAFYEPPGHHSDHLTERIERGVAWILGAPVREIGTNGFVAKKN